MTVVMVSLLLLSLVSWGLGQTLGDGRLESFRGNNRLKYNEKCNYADEVDRQKAVEFTTGMVSTIFSKDPQKVKGKGDLLTSFTSLSEGTYCNSLDHLECSPSGVCQCAKEHKAYMFQAGFERDGDECRLARGSLCVPQDMIEAQRSSNPFLGNKTKFESKCAGDVSCIVKRSGKECTASTFKEEITKKAQAHHAKNKIGDAFEFVMDQLKQGICVCKGPQSVVASTFLLTTTAILMSITNFN